MAFGFPAQHGVQFSVAGGGAIDVRVAVRAALNALDWSIRQDTNRYIFASATISMASWGEKITVQFLPNGSISVSSACAFPVQIFDWGKNKQNIDRLIETIKIQMSESR